MQHIYVANTA